MDNSLAKLLACIEPKIANIGDARVEVKSLNEVLKTISEIVELGKNSYLEILDYYDQDFIIRSLKLCQNSDNLISKYKSTKYLLENQNEDIGELPQFKEATKFMQDLINYLSDLCLSIKNEYQEKSSNLQELELFNKYYLVLKTDSIFVTDADEFILFLEKLNLTLDDRLNILIHVNRCNIKNYSQSLEPSDLFTNEINIPEIKKLLDDNIHLIDDNLILTDYNDNIIVNGKVDRDVIFENKKYLINKIARLFRTFEYDNIAKYYNDYKTLVDYDNEFDKQELHMSLDNIPKLVFLERNNKSLVREYIETCNPVYQGPIFKNLIDLEQKEDYVLPDYCYNGTYLYIKKEFIVKTVYTYLDNGSILILGILDKRMNLRGFLYKNGDLIDDILRNKERIKMSNEERNLLLKDLTIDDLVMSIDLNTLDVKMEEKNAR